MSKRTNIEWCDSTVNFWSGCAKVSDGCKYCYAEAMSNRNLGNIGGWGNGAARRRHETAFKMAMALNKKPWVCDECGASHGEYGWCGNCRTQHLHRRRVFSLSIGDIGDAEVPLEWFNDAMVVIDKCRDVDWLLVTKRGDEFLSRWRMVCDHWGRTDTRLNDNVMVIASVENQKAADERIPQLLTIQARRRGLSCEPLLGAVDLSPWLVAGESCKLDWIIVGGESGPSARPCNIEWIRSLQVQSRTAGIPCFVKQLGTAAVQLDPEHDYAPFPSSKKGGDMAEWPEELRVREFYR